MKNPVDTTQLIFGILGMMGALTFGNYIFPGFLSINPMLAAGIKATAGGALGFAVAEIYKWVQKNLNGGQ